MEDGNLHCGPTVRGIEWFTNLKGECIMNEELLRRMFGLVGFQFSNLEEYIYTEVDVRDMYGIDEYSNKINIFREMLVSFSQRGE
jgi:hypothetical protein